MAVTKSFANTLLSSIFSGGYVGLSTTVPTIDGTGVTEPSTSTGYSRVPASSGNFSASNGAITNSGYVYFPEATLSWGNIKYICVFSSSSGGTLRYFGALTEARDVSANSVPLFRPQSINISITDAEV